MTEKGKTTYVWRPGQIIADLPTSQIYGFCVNTEGLVTLVRDKGEKRFTLPGGRLDGKEDPEDALIREFREEAQFTPIDIKLLGVVEVIEKDQNGTIIKHHQQARFVCRPDKIEEFVPEKDDWETVERIFVPPAELKNYIHWLKSNTGVAQYEALISSL